MYNLILIATNSTPSAPVVYAPSAFFLPETYKDHVVPLRLHDSWREEEITLFWGCGPFLLRAWRRLQRLFQKVHSVCAANYKKQQLKKRSFFIEVARLNLVWHKQCTGGNIRAQTRQRILYFDIVSFSLHSCSNKKYPYWHTQLQEAPQWDPIWN